MAASIFTTTKLRVRVSKPHGCGNETGLFVCGCRSWWWIISIFLMSRSSQLTFCVASEAIPTTTTTSTTPPTSLLKTITTGVGGGGGGGGEDSNNTHTLVDPKIAIALTVSAAFLTLLFLMAFLKFLRFKMRRRPHRDVDDGNRSGNPNIPHGLDIKEAGSVRRFSWDEIERLTHKFSRVIGSGGFSTVYLGHFTGSTLGAIKIHSGSERLNRVFKQELDILLHLQHDNIVKLLGYCDDREEGVLVFEYVPNGSLQEKLHGTNEEEREAAVLSWKSRMAIAFQLARAIEYLHEKCTLHIVHGDIKASNILLDEQLNCKLCDFGFAKMGFSSTVLPPSSMKQVMMGSPGYMDPHYLRTGIASKKNDVYSFGVIVLQLITGMEAFSSETEQLLTSIAGPLLMGGEYDAINVAELVDPRLARDFDLEEVRAMASISALCLGHSPTLRPSATDILRIMTHKISSISFLFSPEKVSRNLPPVHT